MNPSKTSRGPAMMALLSLAIGSFGIGMTEFVTMGLLQDIARDLLPQVWATNREDAIGQAGLLVSLYALGVVIGAPTIAGLLARYPRHYVMLGLAAALMVFNLLTVVLQPFEWVGLSRFLSGLPHGAYFGIGALVAADVLGPGRRAQGVAFILTGLTVANIVGVPLGTSLGQNFGWRAAFLIVTVVFALAAVAIFFFVPPHEGDPSRTLRSELGVFRVGQVWFTLGMGAIGFGGFFAVYSYIGPLVTEVSGAPDWTVPIVLAVMGVGMTIGNLVGGRMADRNLKRTLYIGLFGLMAILILMALTASNIALVAVFGFGVSFMSAVLSPAIQTRLMDVAGENQSIAAAMNHSALNIGNSLGAFLGGVVITVGWGFTAPPLVGAVLALLGAGIAWLAFATEKSRQRERQLVGV